MDTNPPTADTGVDQAALHRLKTGGPQYAAVHRGCRHVYALHPDRDTARTLAAAAPAGVRHQLRIRLATEPDLIAHLRDDRCALCTPDGRITVSAATR